MTPFAVTVRYRYGEGGASKDASFYGLFYDRSEGAVLGRLKEAHRFAAWVEIVEMRWRDRAPEREERRGTGRSSACSGDRRERAPVRAREKAAGGAPAWKPWRA